MESFSSKDSSRLYRNFLWMRNVDIQKLIIVPWCKRYLKLEDGSLSIR